MRPRSRGQDAVRSVRSSGRMPIGIWPWGGAQTASYRITRRGRMSSSPATTSSRSATCWVTSTSRQRVTPERNRAFRRRHAGQLRRPGLQRSPSRATTRPAAASVSQVRDLMVVAHLATGGFARDGQRHLAGPLHEPDGVAPVGDRRHRHQPSCAASPRTPKKRLVRTRWCHVDVPVCTNTSCLAHTSCNEPMQPVERPRPHAYGHEHAQAARWRRGCRQ